MSMISFNKVSFSYDQTPILDNVNFDIDKHDFACIVGPNGGGKSTMVKLMLGLLNPNHGQIELMGAQPQKSRYQVGYVPQSLDYDPQFPVTVEDIVLMGRLNGQFSIRYSAQDKTICKEILARFFLTELRHKSFSNLSGGQKQRLLIARALVCHPKLLILDEPTNGLDATAEKNLYEILSQLYNKDGITIILVSHNPLFVSDLVNKVICVNRTVAIHPTTAISPENINNIYLNHLRLVDHNHDCP